jgi:Na+-driven multidrug efflux pump
MTRTTQDTLPSYRRLLLFFIPLALSSSLMTLEPLIINTALSRAPRAELTLAAYDVMFGIALVIEAPVIMLVSASTALSRTKAAFRRLTRFSLALGAGVVAVGFLVALTPLYGLLVRDVMNIPAPVAEVARPALIIMSVWSLPIAWRRFLQGVLISHDRTPIVTLATVVRLTGLAVTLVIGGLRRPSL